MYYLLSSDGKGYHVESHFTADSPLGVVAALNLSINGFAGKRLIIVKGKTVPVGTVSVRKYWTVIVDGKAKLAHVVSQRRTFRVMQ